MPEIPSWRQEIDAELARLGLSLHDIPGLAAEGPMEAFLRHLRQLSPGCSWRDVFPDWPPHWEAGRPETWITRYRPFGPYDHQELPTAGAIHIIWSASSWPDLDSILSAARAAGFHIFGGGPLDVSGSGKHAMVIMDRDRPEEELLELFDWLGQQRGIKVATVPRTGAETYLP